MTDRRRWDPFAPAPRRARPAAPTEGKHRRAVSLDELRKPALVELAAERGLDTTGTRADLITRLR